MIVPEYGAQDSGSALSQRANAARFTSDAATASGERSTRVHRGIVSTRLIVASYLVSGIFLGLFLLLLLSVLGRRAASRARGANVTGIVHLHPEQIGGACWQDIHATDTVAHLTVVMLVGVDGLVSYVSSAGASPAMRTCVETYARGWEFPPQTQKQMLVMPVEVSSQ